MEGKQAISYSIQIDVLNIDEAIDKVEKLLGSLKECAELSDKCESIIEELDGE